MTRPVTSLIAAFFVVSCASPGPTQSPLIQSAIVTDPALATDFTKRYIGRCSDFPAAQTAAKASRPQCECMAVQIPTLVPAADLRTMDRMTVGPKDSYTTAEAEHSLAVILRAQPVFKIRCGIKEMPPETPIP